MMIKIESATQRQPLAQLELDGVRLNEGIKFYLRSSDVGGCTYIGLHAGADEGNPLAEFRLRLPAGELDEVIIPFSFAKRLYQGQSVEFYLLQDLAITAKAKLRVYINPRRPAEVHFTLRVGSAECETMVPLADLSAVMESMALELAQRRAALATKAGRTLQQLYDDDLLAPGTILVDESDAYVVILPNYNSCQAMHLDGPNARPHVLHFLTGANRTKYLIEDSRKWQLLRPIRWSKIVTAWGL